MVADSQVVHTRSSCCSVLCGVRGDAKQSVPEGKDGPKDNLTMVHPIWEAWQALFAYSTRPRLDLTAPFRKGVTLLFAFLLSRRPPPPPITAAKTNGLRILPDADRILDSCGGADD